MKATLRTLLLAPLGVLPFAALPLGLTAPFAVAQAPTGTVHGHSNNPAGVNIAGTIKLTTDKSGGDATTKKYAYSFDTDANGDFKGADVAPGEYLAVFFVQGKSADFMTVKVVAGADTPINFDMTRKEYVDKMTPEEKKALEDYKKANAANAAANNTIKNLNASLQQARADIKAKNFAPALTAMQQATTQKPDEPILWLTLGDAQLGDADAAATAAKASGGKMDDPALVKKFQDTADSYQKAADLNAASKKPDPSIAGTAYDQLGIALSRIGKNSESSAAYDKAATAQPAMAGTYLLNESITFYNAGKMDEAATAADKAIAADPKKADAYYIKGQALIQKVSVDPKTQKITAPPGCIEAYQKYLELAPDGPHAADVTGILQGIGATVKSSYKAGKKG